VTFDQNQADGRGGAIYNDERGRIEMINGRLTSNRSLTDDGGAVLNAGTMSLALLPIRSNEAANGGGVDNVGGSLDLLDVLIADNSAGSDGGGLRNSGTAKLTNVTVGANRAGVSGGGIDNRADGTLALNNVTVAHNQAGAESEGTGGGIRTGGQGTVDLSNTIVALNTSGKAESDCAGVMRSGGYNLIGSQAGCTITGEAEGSHLDESPGLEALAPNGGEAPSYGLTADSAAVDAGNPAEPDGSGGACAPADQRGVKRPQAGHAGSPPRCDIGAFERKPGA
jgi:hypothetical protein